MVNFAYIHKNLETREKRTLVSVVEILSRSNLEVGLSRISLPEWCKRVKIDVGLSHNAPQSFEWVKQDPDLIVLGFEPVTRNIDAVNEKVRSRMKDVNVNNPEQQIYVIPVALGNNSSIEKADVYITAVDSGCSSLLPPKDFEVELIQETLVVNLSSILEYFPFDVVPYIDHLKIDAQGFDFNILKGVEKHLNRILAVTLEVEDEQYLKSNNNLRQIKKFLRANGFVSIQEAWQAELPFLSQTDDPTFINKKAYLSSKRRDLYLYQTG